MKEEKTVVEGGRERIPRKVRDLFGLLSAKIARVEAQLNEERPDGRRDEGGKEIRRASRKHRYANPPEEQPVAVDEPEKSEELREGEPEKSEDLREAEPEQGEPEESEVSSEGNAEAEEKAMEGGRPEETEDVFSEVPLPDDLEAEVERLVEAALSDSSGTNPTVASPSGANTGKRREPSLLGAETMEAQADADAESATPARPQPRKAGAIGASTTPTNPPLAEDPAKSADRFADGVEAHLDAKFFGNE